MVTGIIGIDCATSPKNVGLALGEFDGVSARVLSVVAPDNEDQILRTVETWIERGPRTLLALDAPLGWPRPLQLGLQHHRAGDPLPGDGNSLFRRETDRAVRQRLGKQSLDVGADRIARTAHSALTLLEQLRQRTGRAIPLAWDSGSIAPAAAIEVYPAATLTAIGSPAAGYKGVDQKEAQVRIQGNLGAWLDLSAIASSVLPTTHVLDALVCVLAGADFLAGRAVSPDRMDLAQIEGWIWVREAARPSDA